jgi:hypothetical protein
MLSYRQAMSPTVRGHPQGGREVSGPIVRKYGFPNFEQIFGKKELQHGVDEPDPGSGPAAEPTKAEPPTPEKLAPKGEAGKK